MCLTEHIVVDILDNYLHEVCPPEHPIFLYPLEDITSYCVRAQGVCIFSLGTNTSLFFEHLLSMCPLSNYEDNFFLSSLPQITRDTV
jgi:hypothetical protein